MRQLLRGWWISWFWLWMTVLAPWAGVAQSATATDALHSMADRAAVVFVGTVTSIRRIPGDGQSTGAVEITFAVEQAVAGCSAGSRYTVREWAGLWTATDRRFRVGERRLMLLHAPGPGGFSAPVDGAAGAIPVVGTAPAIGPHSTTAADVSDAAIADLRWVTAAAVTRALTAPTTPLPLGGTHAAPPHVTARVQPAPFAAVSGSGATPSGAGSSSASLSGQPLRTLLSQIAQWEVGHGR